MKRIALSCNQEGVLGHFGHCHSFLIYDIDDNNTIIKGESFLNPGNENCKLPTFLEDKQVNVLISQKLGEGAESKLLKKNIEVHKFINGHAKKAVLDYINNCLVADETKGGCGCSEHHGHGEHHGACQGHGHDEHSHHSQNGECRGNGKKNGCCHKHHA